MKVVPFPALLLSAIVIGSMARATTSGPNIVFFSQPGGSDVDFAARAVPDNVVAQYRYFGANVVISAFTDRTGSQDYNLRLSCRRARAVGAYLIERGVPAEVMSLRGHGEAAPEALVRTADGVPEVLNRYVRLTFDSRDSPSFMKPTDGENCWRLY